MIISYYPGSGGHRYILFLKNLPFDSPNRHMHQPNFGYHNYRYLTNGTLQDRYFNVDKWQDTHTLNTSLIKKFFPGHKIVKIKADLKKSLCRVWRVVTCYQYINHSMQDQVGQIFDMIVWHHNYYAMYPEDWSSADEVIDIDTDPTEFGKVMRKELNNTDPLFDLAWDVFLQYGPNAPIIDLYNEYT
jgi:hypothetical protein